jgi:hypothetical protein
MKKLSAKIGEYEKDGQTKGRYVEVGVIMQGDNGEYALFDPTVNMAGVLAQQNVMAMQKGEKLRDRVMCSVFDQEQQPQQGYSGYQQPQQGYQQPQQGYQQPQQGNQPPPSNYGR